ncbi:CIA30 family protein [Rubritalea tangerina]
MNWRAVNDGVMGGLSQGGAAVDESGRLVFEGKISLENNGGFSSIRSSGREMDLSGFEGIELKVKGDGRKYYLTARTKGGWRVAFWSPIQPAKGEWVTVKVPFSDFYATSFGRKLPGVKFKTDQITSIGFMLYDKKDGDFHLEVESIGAYK